MIIFLRDIEEKQKGLFFDTPCIYDCRRVTKHIMRDVLRFNNYYSLDWTQQQ